MKKFIFMAAMLLSSVATFAQHEVGSITIQPKIGMNIADLTDVDDSDVRIGLAVGAEAEYQATDLFSVSAGVLYSMQGCKGSEDGVKATIKLDYINIPILANVYVTKGLAVKLGIQPGFNINAKGKVEANGASVEADLDGVKTLDFSIPVGVSYEYQNFVLDARYNFGLTKIASNISIGGQEIANDIDSKNSVFQITLGYKFSL